MSKPDRVSIAQELLHYHLRNDPDILRAFYVAREGGDHAADPLRFLEVTTATSAVGVIPIYFGASKEVPYPVVIIDLAENEYMDWRAGKLPLPEGWDRLVEVFRSAA